MLWHVVKLRFDPDVPDDARAELTAALAGLAEAIPEVGFLRVAPSLDEPGVLGLLTGFEDEAAFAVYRDHPAHLPVLARSRELCAEIVRLDLVTDDPPDALPRR